MIAGIVAQGGRQAPVLAQYPPDLALLLQMEGSDGGSTFVDGSPNPKPITNVGGVTTTTSRVKEGVASAQYGGGATGGLSTPHHSDFAFGTKPLTISAWVYKTNSVYGYVIGQRDGDPCWSLGHNSGDTLEWIVYTLGGTITLTGGRVIKNEWVHYAISRSSTGVWRLRQNGKVVATTTSTNAVSPITYPLRLFTRAGVSNISLAGNIDMAMVVNGVDLYDTSGAVVMPSSISPNPTFFTPPEITTSGGLSVGSTLTCSSGRAWPNAGAYTYQWKMNGSPIVGATSNSYTIASGDDPTKISCTVTNNGTSYTVKVGHRYWRVYVTANNGGAACGISEIEMFTDPATGNRTGSGAASASSEWGSSDAAAEAFNGIFQSSSDAWASGSGTPFPQWIRYDFGAAALHDITSVAINARGSVDVSQAPKDFQIQWSDDGTVWTTSWAVTGQDSWAAFERRTFLKA